MPAQRYAPAVTREPRVLIRFAADRLAPWSAAETAELELDSQRIDPSVQVVAGHGDARVFVGYVPVARAAAPAAWRVRIMFVPLTPVALSAPGQGAVVQRQPRCGGDFGFS